MITKPDQTTDEGKHENLQHQSCIHVHSSRAALHALQVSLLETLREIPDHRRAEGKRFDLATVLLYSILAMVAGANSYRQMHEFIRIHRQLLNEALGLELRYSPSYTGLRLILRGVNPAALETAFGATLRRSRSRPRLMV